MLLLSGARPIGGREDATPVSLSLMWRVHMVTARVSSKLVIGLPVLRSMAFGTFYSYLNISRTNVETFLRKITSRQVVVFVCWFRAEP